PSSTLFPYTTLFRSWRPGRRLAGYRRNDGAIGSRALGAGRGLAAQYRGHPRFAGCLLPGLDRRGFAPRGPRRGILYSHRDRAAVAGHALLDVPAAVAR